jgi:hypothetical protein
MPLIVLPDGKWGILYSAQVVESSEMPPLPVSKMKFRESVMLLRFALMSITPPVRDLKGNWVIYFAGFSINCSCAIAVTPIKQKKM